MISLKKALFEAISKNLSDFQKGLLISVIQSATPEQAYQSVVGSQLSLSALYQLQIMGLVVLHGKSVGVTTTGRQMAIQNNLIDANGQITDEGKHQFDEYQRNKKEFINAYE